MSVYRSGGTYIMLSYARADEALVTQVDQTLAASGLPYFRDVNDIQFGEHVLERISRAVSDATHVLVLLTEASLNSKWVLAEHAIARALKRTLVFVNMDGLAFTPTGGVVSSDIRSLPDLERFLKQLKNHSVYSSMSPVAQIARGGLYYYPGGYVEAIRLFGAEDEVVPASRIHVSYENVPYTIPLRYARRAEVYTQRKLEDARSVGKLFFDGPNVRMLRFRPNPLNPEDLASERMSLEFVLGPVGWYAYEGMNSVFRDEIKGSSMPAEELYRVVDEFIGVQGLLNGGDVSGSQLSNIVDNAITILTKDGKVGYQVRGKRVELPDLLTSTVAENVNRFMDDCKPGSWDQRLNEWNESLQAHEITSADYVPKGIPHPLAAALRGIAEEISPELPSHVLENGLNVTGVSFDLASFHPDILYVAAVDATAEEVLEMRLRSPGKSFFEGVPVFVPADFRDADTSRVLNDPSFGWNPGGKAALVRTLEIIDHLERRQDMDHDSAIERLRRAWR